jgi:predicted MFS family arabinose efflux permease
MGISEALFMPAAIALTGNAFPPATRSRAISALTTAQILGNVGGGWFGGWMAGAGHWRGAFFALGAVGLVFALPYFAFLRGFNEEVQVETRKSGGPNALFGLARTPTYCLLCIVFPVFVFGLWLLYGWLPNFLHEKFSLSLADSAFNATVFLQAATFVGMLTGGMLADMLYHRTKAARLWLLTASLLGCAPFLHFIGNSDTLGITRVAAVGFGLFSGFFMGNIFPAAFEIVTGDARASAVGVLNLFGAVLSGFATLSGGMLKKSVGMENLLNYTTLAYVGGGFVLIAGIRVLFRQDYERVH